MDIRNMSGLVDREIVLVFIQILAPGLPTFKQGYASNWVYLSFLPLLKRSKKVFSEPITLNFNRLIDAHLCWQNYLSNMDGDQKRERISCSTSFESEIL